MYRTFVQHRDRNYFGCVGTQYISEICRHSNSLFNVALFTMKQAQIEEDKDKETASFWDKNDIFTTSRLAMVKTNYAQLCADLKTNEHFVAMPSAIAQQTIKSAVESVKSYNALRKAHFEDPKKVPNLPRYPRYRKSGGYYLFSMPAAILRGKRLDLESGYFLSVPLVSGVKKDEILETVEIQLPLEIALEQLKEVTVKPTVYGFDILWVYDDGVQPLDRNQYLDYSQAIGIDPGIVQWLTIVSTRGKSFYIDGGEIVTAVRKYADKVAAIKKGKSEKYWDLTLSILTEKLNRLKRDLVNKAARFIISHCLKESIGSIVFGRNKQQEL